MIYFDDSRDGSGAAGDWSDADNWWAESSGGTRPDGWDGSFIPTEDDDVTAQTTVSSGTMTCRDMTVDSGLVSLKASLTCRDLTFNGSKVGDDTSFTLTISRDFRLLGGSVQYTLGDVLGDVTVGGKLSVEGVGAGMSVEWLTAHEVEVTGGSASVFAEVAYTGNVTVNATDANFAADLHYLERGCEVLVEGADSYYGSYGSATVMVSGVIRAVAGQLVRVTNLNGGTVLEDSASVDGGSFAWVHMESGLIADDSAALVLQVLSYVSGSSGLTGGTLLDHRIDCWGADSSSLVFDDDTADTHSLDVDSGNGDTIALTGGSTSMVRPVPATLSGILSGQEWEIHDSFVASLRQGSVRISYGSVLGPTVDIPIPPGAGYDPRSNAYGAALLP